MVRRPTRRTDQHPTLVSTAPAVAFIGNASLPIALLVCWVIVIAILLLSLRPRPRSVRSEWFAVMTGPPPERTGPVPTHSSERTDVPVHVVSPDALPDLDGVQGLELETAQLDDLAGVVLDAGRRPVRRTWHGVLLHGDVGSGRTMLVRALAGEHRVPLLVVQAHDLVPERTATPTATVLAHATALMPCVVLIVGVDELSPDRADADASKRRRAVNDLAWHLQTLATEQPVVVIGTAQSVDRVSPLLLRTGCFDRRIAVLGPDRRERERIIRRELILAGATYGGDITDVIQMTCDMSARHLRRLVHAAVQSARLDLGAGDQPVVVTRRDVRAGLSLADAPKFDLRTVSAELSRRVRRFARELDDPQTSAGLALVGEDGNGKTTIARWLADTCLREVTWVTGGDLRSLTTRDLKVIIDRAWARAPVLVVFDDLDAGVDDRSISMIDGKHLAVAIERLLAGPGSSVILTTCDRSVVPRLDDDLIDIWWIAKPSFHDRVHIIRHELADAALLGITPEEIAAQLHGLTREAVVDTCHRALRSAILRTGTHHPHPRDSIALSRDDFCRA